MDNQIPWEKILSVLQHSPNLNDEDFNKWLNKSEENKKLWIDLKDIYAITGKIPEYFQPKESLAWEKIDRTISKPIRRKSINSFFIRVAASILLISLGFIGSRIYTKSQHQISYSEVFSPFGHRTMVTLPDSSIVWLNGNSRIKYQNDFSHSRNIELSGEAMFMVRKNPKNLFTVKSEKLSVKVYGTKFNFRTYTEDHESEICLIEGCIGLFQGDRLISKMKAGELICYNEKSEKFCRSFPNDLAQITSWNSDELIIENKSLEEICRYLERWYGVEIELKEVKNPNQRLTFKVKAESLRELLWIINKIKPIKYTIDGKKVKIEEKLNELK